MAYRLGGNNADINKRYIQDMQLDDVARVLRLPISEVRTLLQF